MVRELICKDCGEALGDPVQSNIDKHKAATGHQDIIDQVKMMDDGNPFPDQGVAVGTAGESATKVSQESVKESEAEETAELKENYPTKKEQKEIEKLAEEKEDNNSKKKSKYNY